MDVSKYKDLYLREALEHVAGIESSISILDSGRGAEGEKAVDALFRHYHSLKGMSASMGYDPIKRLAHVQEDLLEKVRAKKLEYSAQIKGSLLRCLDLMRDLLKRVEEGVPLDIAIDQDITRINAIIEGKVAKAPVAAMPKGQPVSGDIKLSQYMRVEGRVFDDLLGTAGDLFMALSSFKAIAYESRSIELRDAVYALGKNVSSLHDKIMGARMLQFDSLVHILSRVVRELSGASGKFVELKAEGAEISLDRAVIEALASPLVHIVRNALDHGIELPEERRRLGKGPTARISLRAFSRKDRAIIEISDDGRGIDLDKIRKKAIESGLARERVLAMTEKEALMLICMPGLSSSESVTETSGRGVGMDVVKETVEKLGGSLDIESRPGLGSRFLLEIPRASSIVRALCVSVGEELFLVPISRIQKVSDVGLDAISSGVFEHDGEKVPVVKLREALNMAIEAGKPEPKRSTLLVLEKSGALTQNVAIAVDDFEDEFDAYIRPLSPPISKLWGVGGLAIMGDGRPVFLLDVSQIASRALRGA